jgi:hypothetical protein
MGELHSVRFDQGPFLLAADLPTVLAGVVSLTLTPSMVRVSTPWVRAFSGSHDLELGTPQRWPPRPTVDQNPDRVRRFRREAVQLQCAEQAGVGHARGHLRHGVQLGHGRLAQPVNAAIDVLEQPTLGHSAQVGSRDASFLEIPSPKGPGSSYFRPVSEPWRAGRGLGRSKRLEVDQDTTSSTTP